MNLNVALRFSSNHEIPVGILSEVGREIAFEFSPSFLSAPLPIAPFKLPMRHGITFYDRTKGGKLFGVFEDSLPDGWGRRLQDDFFQRHIGRLPTVFERLSYVGTGGQGALVYHPDVEIDAMDKTIDLSTLATSAMAFDAGDARDILPEVRRAGGSSGGARPKASIGYNPQTKEVCPDIEALPPGFEHWLVKFPNQQDVRNAGELEWQYAKMAVAAGVEMSDFQLIQTSVGNFFATRRFDRTEHGGRLHFASAAGLLDVDYRIPGNEYRTLFRLTDALTHDYSAKKELFRRTTLNVLAHNRDDHLKNFGFLMDCHGTWRLAPFYDFTYATGPNGWQTLSVAGEGRDPGPKDLLRLAQEVDLTTKDAQEIIEQVASTCGAVSDWRHS